MRRYVIFIPLLLVAIATSAQKDSVATRFAGMITPEELREHLEYLASDELAGRETATDGQRMAAAYIEEHFRQLGLSAYEGDKYQQAFDVISKKPSGSVVFQDTRYNFMEDLYFYESYGDTSITGELVFAGSGNRKALTNTDLAGKIALVFDDTVGSLKPDGTSSDWKYIRRYGTKNCVQAILVVTPEFESKKQIVEYYLGFSQMILKEDVSEEEDPGIPFLFISRKMGEELVSSSGIKLKKLHKADVGDELDIEITMDFTSGKGDLSSTNVLGVLPGTTHPDDYLFITAHYDHLGTKGKLTFNGADDDGSGTSALLTMASAFKKASDEGHGPARTIVFMAVSGEEKGLLGSDYYTRHPIFPLENTIADLNVDMIGRIDEEHTPDSNYVYLIGSDRLSTELHEISEQVNNTYTQLDLDYTYNDPDDPNQFYYRSDHYNFARNNIPVIFYFSGIHEDYHMPTDTVEKIQFVKTATITKLIFHTAWELANREERIVVDKENED